jgi:hypothetical protein
MCHQNIDFGARHSWRLSRIGLEAASRSFFTNRMSLVYSCVAEATLSVLF